VALVNHCCYGFLGGCSHLDGLEKQDTIDHRVMIVRGLQWRICKRLGTHPHGDHEGQL
jgi:hypothetical protein